jgi:hypothetical protein
MSVCQDSLKTAQAGSAPASVKSILMAPTEAPRSATASAARCIVNPKVMVFTQRLNDWTRPTREIEAEEPTSLRQIISKNCEPQRQKKNKKTKDKSQHTARSQQPKASEMDSQQLDKTKDRLRHSEREPERASIF